MATPNERQSVPALVQSTEQDADTRGRKIPTPALDGQRWTQFPAQAAA